MPTYFFWSIAKVYVWSPLIATLTLIFLPLMVLFSGRVTVTLVTPFPDAGEMTTPLSSHSAVHSLSSSTVNVVVFSVNGSSTKLGVMPLGATAYWFNVNLSGVTPSPIKRTVPVLTTDFSFASYLI